MSYKDKNGYTKIKDSFSNNLTITYDNLNEDGEEPQKVPVLLFTPDMENTKEHYHIVLDKQQAKKLNKWLENYLKDVKND